MKAKILGRLLAVALVFQTTSCDFSQHLFEEGSDTWNAYGDASWEFLDGNLIGQVNNQSGFVMTTNSYKDFRLDLEFYPDSTINSGVFIRCTRKELSATDCHELNIWDLHPNQDFRTGAIVTKAVPQKKVETMNQWNTYRIETRNSRIQVWINGHLTADAQLVNPPEGYIALQAMGKGRIQFRNMVLTEIKP